MTDRAPDIKEILDSYDRSQEALNFTPRSDNDIRAQMIAKAVREWNGDLGEILAAVLDCALSWEPDARIIGNIRAGDIVRALTELSGPTSQSDAPTESILRPLADRGKSADDLMDQAREKRRHASALITDAEMLEQLAYDMADYCGGGEP